ncbi:transcriptional regulator [Desulfoscipio sp. XC116]|uniref:transcriptional regulator n=1 Tax=Desulfoscipio sp. XC116 TaxID=3144975 RepID=UPI00325A47D7
MGVVESILDFLLILLVVNGLFNYWAFLRAKKEAARVQEEKAKLKPEVEEEIEMVTDNICGCTLPKSEAYVLIKDDQRHYFCSWDCREKFIETCL